MADNSQRPIVVKKIKKGGHGHHGGAWKIAYADFVTAMMAFFLLMWLLGSTAKGDLNGIAEFFANPLKVSLSGGSGSGDATSVVMSGGNDITKVNGQIRDGYKDRVTKTSGQSKQEFNAGSNNFKIVTKAVNSPVQSSENETQISSGKSREKGSLQLSKSPQKEMRDAQSGSSFQAVESDRNDALAGQAGKGEMMSDTRQLVSQISSAVRDKRQTETRDRLIQVKPIDEKQLTAKAIALVDRMKRDTLQRELEQEKLATIIRYMNIRIAKSAYLSQFKDQILMDLTNQGLRIQVVDRNKREIFKKGQTIISDEMKPVFQAIGNVLSSVNNYIQVSGHTDASAFQNKNQYDNWDLSAERANSARRELIRGGLNPHRVVRVSGFSDVIPFNIRDPEDSQNRRVSILVMTEGAVRDLFHH